MSAVILEQESVRIQENEKNRFEFAFLFVFYLFFDYFLIYFLRNKNRVDFRDSFKFMTFFMLDSLQKKNLLKFCS